MVELQVQALDADGSLARANDLYVNIRVGEEQKRTRLCGNARVFKFSAKERQWGKLEVFQRVGGCTFGAGENLRDAVQEISMPCDDGRADIRFRVAHGKTARQALVPDGKPPASQEEQSSAPRDRAEAYLKHHNLEVRLAEVLQLLLRDRPDDPASYVYERLQKNEHMIAQLQVPKTQPNASPPERSEDELADFRKASEATCELQRNRQDDSAPDAAVVALARDGLLAAANDGSLGTVLQDVLKAEVDDRRRWQQLPSVGTWISPVFTKATAPDSSLTPIRRPARILPTSFFYGSCYHRCGLPMGVRVL